ncbi:hypothetical protein ESZ53_12450 [Salinibacterium sp. UTAS2018]|uniref:hypothetical protein n=1 Tax=Salinibacterium sp. UTAS2018 TaxID=2508880 RepID=UPI001009628E|nr:hypothetical protein [Salinibacterium sp. UTAS2018]QAV71178.1 hypothetical protein ESZ53_12450 [Salinibacterium sp. UTAS2018]
MTKSVMWAICGAASGAVFVFVAGILTIQASGLAAGAQYALNNSVQSIITPRVPYLMMGALALLGLAATFALTVAMRHRSRASQLAFIGSFSTATLLLVIASFALGATGMTPETPMIGVAPGWQGWLNRGGSSSAVHLVLLLAVGLLWMRLRSPQRAPDVATASRPQRVNTLLRSAMWGLLGMLLGVLFISVIGMLSAQVAARRLGVVLDLNNMVTTIASSTVGYLPMIAIALLSALMVFALTVAVRNRLRKFRVALVVGFSAATIVLLAVSFILAPLRGPKAGLSIGIEPGWLGWLAEGSSTPAVHIVVLVAVGALLASLRTARSTPKQSESAANARIGA